MDNVINQIYRKENRRVAERRTNSRRVNTFTFGSSQWVKEIESSYTFWPKEDRRTEERRTTSRRKVERRTGLENYRRQSLRQQAMRRNGLSQRQRLTPEEIKMLAELNNRS